MDYEQIISSRLRNLFTC